MSNINFVEGKDYRLIDVYDKNRYDYIIQIRFEPDNDTDPFCTWEIGVMNPIIVQNKKYINQVVSDYLSNALHKPYDSYRIAFIDYSKDKDEK